MKIVGGDTCYYYYILCKYFKIQKFAKNSKIICPSKKHKPYSLYPTEEPCIISKRLNEYHRRRCILQLQYMIPYFQKFQEIAKNWKMIRWSEKHKLYCIFSTKEPCIISKRLNKYPRRRCILQLLYILLFQKFSKFVKKSKIIWLESYPIKPVGGDRFWK